MRPTLPLAGCLAAVFLTVAPAGLVGQAPPKVPAAGSKVPVSGYTVAGSYPHDPKALALGLEYRDGFLYEGTSERGQASVQQSSVRQVELETGKMVREQVLGKEYPHEGVTITAGKLFEVTGVAHSGFVYDVKTFKLIRQFSYFGDGWGLTHDTAGLVMSDGTSSLRFLETTRFSERRRIKVADAGTAIAGLADLEFIRGEIWAVIAQADYVARIAPADGRVTGWINLKGLLGGPGAPASAIAYDSVKDRIFVTGPRWPKLLEIKLK